MTRITKPLALSRLKEVLDYDQETGNFVWKVHTNRGSKPGDIAGWSNALGYIAICIDGSQYLAHRLAWLFSHGEMPFIVDHKDGNKSNNALTNLRSATKSQNVRNQKRRSDNTSGFKGVSFSNARKKWWAYIYIDGKTKHLGYFKTAEDAHAAYCEAAEKFFGEFARAA